MNPFPIINNSFEACPEDGILFLAPLFCTRNFNAKCINFYKEKATSNGFFKCPYGFTVVFSKQNGDRIIYSGLNIKGVSDRKNIQKRETKNESIPLISKNDFERIIQKFSLYTGAYIMEKNKNRENLSIIRKASFESKLISNTLHELRKLNKQIKIQSEYLRAELEKINCNSNNCDKSNLKNRSFNIFSTSQLITTRLNSYDFTVNPSLTENIKRQPISVFKKFEKACHCLELSAKDKELDIKIIGQSTLEINCFRIFELLPFILIENAVKYSPIGKDIMCIFQRSNRILIKSIGPKPIEHDLSILFEKEQRSKSVQSFEGSGLGLYLAKKICDYHNIEIKIELGTKSEFFESIEYTDFILELNIKNQSA